MYKNRYLVTDVLMVIILFYFPAEVYIFYFPYMDVVGLQRGAGVPGEGGQGKTKQRFSAPL